jgi:hypothetical protein
MPLSLVEENFSTSFKRNAVRDLFYFRKNLRENQSHVVKLSMNEVSTFLNVLTKIVDQWSRWCI